MSQYKNTLNLPTTAFPMKANLAQREPELLKKWDALSLYEQIRSITRERKKFIFLDGPPYANGHIHMGTAVNKILKDMVIKAKGLSGFDASFVPGWDCHGLPIELNVEKKMGKAGHKITAKEFREACRHYASKQVDLQREEFKRLGIIADWQRPYLTMDFAFEADVVRSLAKILKKGYLQSGEKPVYWCLDCASALAETEVEYQNKTSPAIDVRFKVVDEKAFFQRIGLEGEGPIFVPIWTTTPWTLPANQAVALNAAIEYVLVETEYKEKLLLAAPLLAQVMQRYKIKAYSILSSMLGEKLEHVILGHPFYARQVPMILADFVTMESGTGAVHVAAAHGPDDYYVAKRYGLPLINLIADNGCFNAGSGFMEGMHVNKANACILEELQKGNALLNLETISHSYPHCWRHKTALIFRVTPQWFISMEKNNLRQRILEAIKEVDWVPEWGFNRISSMVANRPDWCISRQRSWGVPLAIFTHKKTGELHPDTCQLMEKIALRIEKQGVEAWFSLEAVDLLGREAEEYNQCMDVLDVWFDSGVVHECVLRQRAEGHFPADLFLEGSDQHRGWFNSSIVTSIAMNEQAPYKAVLTHGYVIDVQGRKMSKSLGNVISPETIVQSYGADVLRLWVCSIDYRSDIFVSEEVLMRTAETYRRIRNTARFLLANLSGFDPIKNKVPVENMLALDLWAVDAARSLQEEIIKAYEAYQFHLIYQKIHQFCSSDLGSFYLDIIKDRQYTTQTDSLPRRSTQTAMYHIIEALVRWIAPVLSFTAEEIWHYIPGERGASVFFDTWYSELTPLPLNETMGAKFWEVIRAVRNAVNKEIETLRHTGKLGAPLEAEVQLYCEASLKTQLDKVKDELRFILITSSATVYLADPQNISTAHPTEIAGLWLIVAPLTAPKCERCWHRRAEIGSGPSHPTLCARCIVNVEGEGEVRKYA